jgi:hypothetical protein
MTERWRRELRRVRKLEPSQDLWARAQEGSHLREPRSVGAVASVAFLVVAVGLVGYLAWRAFEPSRVPPAAPPAPSSSGSTPTSASPSAEGFFISFPDTVEASGGARFLATTNLPDGTKVVVEYTEGEGGGFRCCPEVKGGMVQVEVEDSSCLLPRGHTMSTGFEVKLTVVPDVAPLEPECLDPNGCSSPQPASVLDVLGRGFERLTGAQVTSVDGIRALVATRAYRWPDGVCDASKRSMIPEDCPAENGEAISEVTPNEAAADLVGIFLQERLCELWGAATPSFQQANPWPQFSGRVGAWVEGLGPLVSPNGDETFLERQVVSESPETFTGYHGETLPVSFVARYLYRGEPVAEAEFVNVGPRAEHTVTQWRVERLDLR